MEVSGKTLFLDEHGKILVFTDLRAGDTVWVAVNSRQRSALRIRKGPMTLEKLHQIHVRFPQT